MVANSCHTNPVEPDQPDQEGVNVPQDRPTPASTRAPASQDHLVSADVQDGNPGSGKSVKSSDELSWLSTRIQCISE